MKFFYLKNKEGEVLSKSSAYSMEDAISYFSKVKRLAKKDLLEIYIITE